MVAAPDRVDMLEKRLAALEAEVSARPKLDACALCGGAMKVTAEEPHPMLGDFGVLRHTLTCQSCGRATDRRIDPRKP